jgi:hypothetical protein
MLSGSIDNPEGGLDALMQTIVCKEEIGMLIIRYSFQFHYYK